MRRESMETTMAIVVSKSVKNTDTAEEKGFDAGKTSGVKLHIAADILGLPHAMFVTTANVTDRDGAISMIGYAASDLPKCLKVLLDGGYTGEKFAGSVMGLIGADRIRRLHGMNPMRVQLSLTEVPTHPKVFPRDYSMMSKGQQHRQHGANVPSSR